MFEHPSKLDESTGYKSGDERSGKSRGTGFLMAVIFHEYQDTKYRHLQGSAKAISGTMKRRKNAKKRERSRLEASPHITRRRQWD